MPSELQNRPDLRLGDDRGRIYRIVPAGERPKQARPGLSAAPTNELVELLRHKNAWWRETAARLLYERHDHTEKGHLEAIVRSDTQPAARIAGLWVLAGLDVLSAGVIEIALADPHPGVREQAVVLANRQLQASPALEQKLIALASDRDTRVRFRVALALGGLKSDRRCRAIGCHRHGTARGDVDSAGGCKCPARACRTRC